MTVVGELHEDLGAVFRETGGHRMVEHYGRPERTHEAVRKGVGTIEMPYGVLEVTGKDRHAFVDNAVSNQVRTTDGVGCYALLLDPDGTVRTDMYIYTAEERFLVLTPADRAEPLADDWSGKTFIQDVEVVVATDRYGVFGVHGPSATEKIASVVTGTAPPVDHLTFVRGKMADTGVTIIRADAPAGEEGFEVVCGADEADAVFDTLINRGLNAVPFGTRTWRTLTLEAGTPLFEPDIEGRIPNALGVRNAIDFEKGCFVGQEVVSRIENRGRPPNHFVGLRPAGMPSDGAAVFDGDEAVGEVTRAAESPSLEAPIALALIDGDPDKVTVRIDGDPTDASVVPLPFVEGSDRSARLPTYP